jgi:cyclase
MAMRRIPVRVLVAAALVLATASTLVRAADQEPDWSKITFKTTKLADGVYMIEGAGGFSGGNVGVLAGPDGLIVIDDSFQQLAPKLQGTLKEISDKPVKLVLNTHFHGDHSSGNAVFGAVAPIIAHTNTRVRLERDGWRGKPAPAAALPVITVDDAIALHLDGEDVIVTHVGPAHTDSDLTVTFEKAKVVHMGDVFFNGLYPFIDFEHGGGSVKGYVAAVERSLARMPADVKIIPGHGPLGTRRDLEAYLAMLKDTTSIVEKGIAAGKTADDLKKAKVFARYDEAWSKGFMKTDDYIDELYEGLGGKKK